MCSIPTSGSPTSRKHFLAVFRCPWLLQELIAGAADTTEVKKWEAAKKRYEQENKLLVPTADDWLIAGTLNAMLRGLRSRHDGKTPKLPDWEKQRIIRDVLIARTVRRVGALLVTNNTKEFSRIKDLRLSDWTV